MLRSVAESKLERKASTLFFLNSERSPVATPAPPGWRLGRPLPTTPAVDGLPDSAPPRAYSGLPATSENALSISASAPAKTPVRHRPICESPFRAGCGRQTRVLYTAPVLPLSIWLVIGSPLHGVSFL